MSWDDSNLLTTGELSVVAAVIENADFDGDGNIDGQDFLTWQRGFGNPGSLATGDAYGDEDVNAIDLGIWQAQFGSVELLVGAQQVVPEPSGPTLIVFCVLSLINVRRKTNGNKVHVHLSKCVTGARQVKIVREDGSTANLSTGNGMDWLVFSGGTLDSLPVRFDVNGDSILGSVATLSPRQLESQALPDALPRKTVKGVLVGDSTVASYKTDHAYQGWGWALGRLFDDRVTFVNEARGGRSSKSYRSEGHWDRAIGQQADYVLIQFGHNDNPGKGTERETNPAPKGDFRDNLARYVAEARQSGARVALVSPSTRRTFVEGETIDPFEGNLPYAEAVLMVAQEVDCPVIDLNRLTRQLFERLGKASSDWLQPIGDTTHFTPAGAKRIASTLASELVEVERSLKQGRLWSASDGKCPAGNEGQPTTAAPWCPTGGVLFICRGRIALT